MSHPYSLLPASSFWRKSVAGVPSFDLDPMVDSPFKLAKTDRIATGGSCFAQHIARNLPEHGLNYFVAETAPPGTPAEHAHERNFTVFSARYGNLYTARQLVQLFDRAFGSFTPILESWPRAEGGLVDPFRPQIEPKGFATIDELRADRAEHFAAVRRMLTELDVFVFTLGLTEGWRDKEDGAVLPLAPGVAGGEWDPARYEFVNFSAAEVTADLLAFLDRLARINPRAKVILTVSPVPLVATYEPQHVLAATVYSKSVLRVAAEEVRRARSNVAYFPSYEIIVSPVRGRLYFDEDLRSVLPEGVKHVMRVFFHHFVGGDVTTNLLAYELEAKALRSVVCDEEAIER